MRRSPVRIRSGPLKNQKPSFGGLLFLCDRIRTKGGRGNNLFTRGGTMQTEGFASASRACRVRAVSVPVGSTLEKKINGGAGAPPRKHGNELALRRRFVQQHHRVLPKSAEQLVGPCMVWLNQTSIVSVFNADGVLLAIVLPELT